MERLHPVSEESPSPPTSPRRRLLRRRVGLLIALQVLLPALMLGLRWSDPSLDQLPFGWQMHTNCWGAEKPCR